MSTRLDNGAMTYEAFFGLREKPFSLAADPRFLFLSRPHTAAYDKLLAGIRRREGLLVLTGDIGTGKTTLCRAALQGLDRKTFSAFVPDPFASREDLLKILLIDFGVTSIRELTAGSLKNATRTELSYLLSAFLDTLGPLQAFVVVIIDEAQNMSAPLIEEIRILSDARGRDGQLQMVFVGQLELHERLRLPEMRQVDQRVSVYCRLEPLELDDVRGYVHYRLQVAGGTLDRVHFLSDAIELLHTVTRGVPRLINRICDRALYVAYLRRVTAIDPAIVEAALQEIAPELLAGAAGGPPRPAALAPPRATGAAPTPGFPMFAAPHGAESATPPDRVDEWLNRVEGGRPSTSLGAAEPSGAPAPGAATRSPAEMFGEDDSGWREEMARALQPETHMRRLRRRWLRRVRTAVLYVALWTALVAAAVQAISVWDSSKASHLDVAATEPAGATLTPPPLQPALPVEPAVEAGETVAPPPADAEPGASVATPEPAPESVYIVRVAVFRTLERADRLVEGLNAAGFAAFRRPFTLRSGEVMQQVLLGPYPGQPDAAADLQRLQQTSGYEDAHVAALANR